MLNLFFVGVSVAVLLEVGKNQGLAGGAIILGYGFVGSIIALVVAIILNNILKKRYIVFVNKVLVWVIIVFSIGFTLNYFFNIKPKKTQEQQKKMFNEVSYGSINIASYLISIND